MRVILEAEKIMTAIFCMNWPCNRMIYPTANSALNHRGDLLQGNSMETVAKGEEKVKILARAADARILLGDPGKAKTNPPPT